MARVAAVVGFALQASLAAGNLRGSTSAKTCGALFCAQSSVCCDLAPAALCGSPGSTCCYNPGKTFANLCAPGSVCNFATGTCSLGSATHLSASRSNHSQLAASLVTSVQALVSSGPILAKHNDLRAGVSKPCTAADMPELSWSTTLASHAQSWADQLASRCGNPYHERQGSEGANIYWSSDGRTDATSLVGAVQSWYDEGRDLEWIDGNTAVRSKMYPNPERDCAEHDSGPYCKIGHYLQVVSAKVTEVGCGVATCSSQGFVYFVCRYNTFGARLLPRQSHLYAPPWTLGAPCAACPHGCVSAPDGKRALCQPNQIELCVDKLNEHEGVNYGGHTYHSCAAFVAKKQADCAAKGLTCSCSSFLCPATCGTCQPIRSVCLGSATLLASGKGSNRSHAEPAKNAGVAASGPAGSKLNTTGVASVSSVAAVCNEAVCIKDPFPNPCAHDKCRGCSFCLSASAALPEGCWWIIPGRTFQCDHNPDPPAGASASSALPKGCWWIIPGRTFQCDHNPDPPAGASASSALPKGCSWIIPGRRYRCDRDLDPPPPSAVGASASFELPEGCWWITPGRVFECDHDIDP